MTTFAIIALIFAGLLIMVGLLLLFRNKDFCKVVADLATSPSQLFTWSLMALILGLVVLGHEYRIALPNWYWVIPLLGWLSLIKGAWIMLFPDTVKRMIKLYCPPGATTSFFGLISLVIGAGLLWLALAAY
ncbi:MAG: hypothetical protein PHR51_00800 [Patescibacteria group bacterium]|nr:hypothetical protein [Patescibacteria group bacterium]